jgi:photosystem II stability/assembly factor-like uncharacterized protein
LGAIGLACILAQVNVFDTRLSAADRAAQPNQSAVKSREPSPIEDDANLNDIQFVDGRHGWAVGDHGVIWHSEDAGETWTLQSSGVKCPLRSVCFLSNLVGWVGGGGTVPFTRRSYGVVLYTIDGGRTWENLAANPSSVGTPASAGKSGPVGKSETRRLSSEQSTPGKKRPGEKPSLSRIRKIKFFTPDDGIIVGDGTGVEPGGAYATDDGGLSWRALPGKAAPGWLGADFFNPDAGVLVGVRDSVALAVEGKLVVPRRFERFGERGRHDVTLREGRGGWLVGDGGLVRHTENEGLVWQEPPSPMPHGTRDTFDFRTVCCRGDKVWVAGNPGSAIWHSPDAGRTWQKQRTGQSIPLARLHFTTEDCGWAVGALGSMLRTKDGGSTWKAVRGGGRRAALMALYGRGRQVSLGLIAELSGESGYRGVVSVVAHEDDEEQGINTAEWSDRLSEAVTSAGGSAAQVGWQLPLVIPGLERDFDRLVADWNRRTENRLDEVLIGAIVRQIRTWRPSVLIIEQPEAGDALARLIGEAAQRAVEQAADSTCFVEHQELAGLEPWQVQRILVRLPAGSSGHVNVDPFAYLPHLGETTSIVAATAQSMFLEHNDVSLHREAYRVVSNRKNDDRDAPYTGRLFAGISIPAGSAARRDWIPLDESGLDARLAGIRKLKNFAKISEKVLEEDRRAGQLIAQLPDICKALPAAEAAWQLMHLADQYQAAGHWEWAELTLIELCEKYPDQPAGLRAMQRLVQSWASGEVTWRRLKKSAAEQGVYQNQPEVSVPTAIEYVEARLRKQSENRQRTIFNSDDDEPDPIFPIESNSTPKDGMLGQKRVTLKDLEQKQRVWRKRAMNLFAALARRDPALAAEPAVQFPVAAIYRQRTSLLKSDAIYRRFVLYETGTPWAQAAESELWLTNVSQPPTGPMTPCGFTPTRPVLDGVLSDPCWQDAAEIPLNASPGNRETRDGDRGDKQAFAMLSYDAEFLYFAARLPRAAGVRIDGPAKGDRRHDDDLAEHDRVVLSLDVDRDYVTYFNFEIDERGCTSESCWQDTSWNPRWWVEVLGDEKEWRLEVAIPLEEIAPFAPRQGMAWAIGIARIIPAVGLESWTHPAAASPRPETFGLLRFDQPGSVR